MQAYSLKNSFLTATCQITFTTLWMLSLPLSPTLIVIIIIIIITITIIIVICPLQMSLELWKAGQSPTEIDRSKTKDITFHRPKPLWPNPQQVVPAPLLDTKQVSDCSVWWRSYHHCMSEVISNCRLCILAVTNQRLYLLNKLKHSGLGEKGFDNIYSVSTL